MAVGNLTVIEQFQPDAFPYDSDDVVTTETAASLAIVDGDTYQQGFDLLDAFNELERRIVAYHAKVKQMANLLVNAVRQREADDLLPVRAAKLSLSRRLAAWKTAQDELDRQAQIEEQARADAAAQAAQQRKAETLTKLADVEPDPDMAEALKAEAAAVAAVPVTAPVVQWTSHVPVIAGGFTRKNWRAEVPDVRALVRAWLDGQCSLPEDDIVKGLQTFLNTQARSHKNQMASAYPGTKAVYDEGAVKRRG